MSSLEGQGNHGERLANNASRPKHRQRKDSVEKKLVFDGNKKGLNQSCSSFDMTTFFRIS
jgi:hypothetical protein